MRWEDFRRSDNVEDVRGGLGGGGGGFGFPGGGSGLSIGTIVVLGLVGWALGIDPRILIGGAEMLGGGRSAIEQQQRPQQRQQPRDPNAPRARDADFVAAILGDTEDRWRVIFERAGQRYREPKLTVFSGVVNTQCGRGLSAMGPFYCPTDQKIYLDTSFFRDMQTRFGACPAGSKSCEFSQAYVIAHEVGHHVQNLLRILPNVQQQQRGMEQRQRNLLQVKVELQADCLAGIWAHHAQAKWGTIDRADIEAALQTASAIGDDRLQKRSGGRVVPESFTHGSSEQRMRWFTNGFRSGNLSACNTFAPTANL